MGKVTGFLEIDRHDRKYKPAADRVRNFNEFVIPLSDSETKKQAARCMDCGIPFCHNGCPVNNQIPDWNDLVTLETGKKPHQIFTQLIIFQNLQGEFALHHARPRAH